ncbi:MAG: DMT family transporter [Micavibrio sp.]
MPHTPPSSHTQTLHAASLVILGYCGYSVADLCSKIMLEYYSIYQILGVSSLIGLIATSAWLLIGHGKKSFLPAKMKLHLLRAVFVTGVGFFMVSALRTLPLADFYGIVFIMPFIVMILAILLLGEKVGWRRWGAALVGFSGIIVLAGPQFEQIGEGVFFALLGALCAALNIILLRKIGSGEPAPLYGVFPFLLSTLFNLSVLFMLGDFKPYQIEHLVYVFVHGGVLVLGIVYLSKGFSLAPETAIVAPLHYTQIIWGVLFGWIFYNVVPTATTMTGVAMVIAAGLYSIRRDYKIKHSEPR